MTEPTTAAGRAHWALHAESRVSLSGILAIEAEARAAALDEARAAVDGVSWMFYFGPGDVHNAVLAAIDALRESGNPAKG